MVTFTLSLTNGLYTDNNTNTHNSTNSYTQDNLTQWYINISHWVYDLQLELECVPDNQEEEPKHPQQNIAPQNGYLANLIPKSINQINWANWSSPVSKYFTVGEVCQWDTKRIPTETNIKFNILKLAQELDKIRTQWSSGIGVTSWYRTPKINAQVGGVTNSRHILGNAVDIYPINGSIGRFQEWLDGRWYGNLGYGAKKGFVHIDMGNNKGWMSGGSKGVRWNY